VKLEDEQIEDVYAAVLCAEENACLGDGAR
jgi:hypothetical protein